MDNWMNFWPTPYNFLPINTSAVKTFSNPIPPFPFPSSGALGFWGTGPSGAVLHVSRALCFPLPLPSPGGKLECPGAEKELTGVSETEQTVKPVGPGLRGLDDSVSTFPLYISPTYFISLFFSFTALLIHGVWQGFLKERLKRALCKHFCRDLGPAGKGSSRKIPK